MVGGWRGESRKYKLNPDRPKRRERERRMDGRVRGEREWQVMEQSYLGSHPLTFTERPIALRRPPLEKFKRTKIQRQRCAAWINTHISAGCTSICAGCSCHSVGFYVGPAARPHTCGSIWTTKGSFSVSFRNTVRLSARLSLLFQTQIWKLPVKVTSLEKRSFDHLINRKSILANSRDIWVSRIKYSSFI